MVPTPLTINCDNEVAIYVASNPVFHMRIKNIEVDCPFICDMVIGKQIVTPHISSKDQ